VGGATVTSYVLNRDGAPVGAFVPEATPAGGVFSLRDKGLLPTKSYEYSVTAEAGDLKSDPSDPVTGRTPPAPLSTARLDGTYRVTETVTASALFNQHPGQALTYTWIFNSACSTGTCGGKWMVQFSKSSPAHGHFNLIPGGFLGAMNGQSLTFCGSTQTATNASHQDSGTMRIHTVRAALKGRQWVVVNFTGTFREYSPAFAGCSSSTFQAQLDARRSSTPGSSGD